jgi:hypothetical protein
MQVILRMRRLTTPHKSTEVLGNFRIDLDALRSKAVQFFPFGRECVLQINLYNPSLPSSPHNTHNIPQPIGKHLSARNSRHQPDQRLLDRGKLPMDRKEGGWRAEFSRNKNGAAKFGNNDGFIRQSVHEKMFKEKVYGLLQ